MTWQYVLRHDSMYVLRQDKTRNDMTWQCIEEEEGFHGQQKDGSVCTVCTLYTIQYMLQLLPVDVLYHSLSRRLEHNCWLKEIERGTDRQTDNERQTDRQAMRECVTMPKKSILCSYVPWLLVVHMSLLLTGPCYRFDLAIHITHTTFQWPTLIIYITHIGIWLYRLLVQYMTISPYVSQKDTNTLKNSYTV